MLYPLSYGGNGTIVPKGFAHRRAPRAALKDPLATWHKARAADGMLQVLRGETHEDCTAPGPPV